MSVAGPPRPGSRPPPPLLVATSSAHKLAEIRRVLAGLPRELLGLADLPGGTPPEPDEPFGTFLENARHKAAHYARIAGLPTLADDSGIAVDALAGEPGVRSKRFSGRRDLAGADLDRANNDHLLERLDGVPLQRRTAHYACAAVLALPGGVEAGVVGTRSGLVLDAPRGTGGFGYDPLFLVPERGLTFGELPADEKSRTSHRARAFRALRATMRTMGLLALALLALPLRPLDAQAVRGRVLAADAAPLHGAFVVLVDARGRDVAGTLSHPDGRYTLAAPGPGEYALRAERIGFAVRLDPPVPLAAGDTLQRDLVLQPQAVALAEIRVEGEERCRLPRESAAAAARIWEEARKALRVTAWASRAHVFRFRLLGTLRVLDPDRLRTLEASEQPSVGYHAGSPYVSLDARDLAQDGYIRGNPRDGWSYYAPDADVLLSDAFLDGHCFRAVERVHDGRRLLGLAFEPLRRDHRRSDVRGTLWVDAATAELASLEFGYTSLPVDLVVGSAVAGGRVDFARLPSGAWFVRSWWIRSPEVFLTHTADGRRRYGVARVIETGGRVTRVRTSAGDVVPADSLR